MKVVFVYNVEDEYWDDGLRASLRVLSQKHSVKMQNDYFKPYLADVVLVWGALGSRQARMVANADTPYMKKAICIAGGPISHPDVHNFDVVFVETLWHVREFKKIGINAIRAFGTNTDLFKPVQQKKKWEAIYPAAFAKWKRHSIFAKRYRDNGLAVGYMQPNDHERECIDVCVENNVTVLPRVKPNVMPYLYAAADKVHITSDVWGGGERTVLEGLACGLDVVVEDDNPKLVGLLREQSNKLLTHVDYAKSLEAGLLQCLN